MKSHRLARISEVVRETAANSILFDIKDPRVKNVTVTRAEVSGDLQHAKVFVSVMGTEREQKLTMHGLKSAAGFIQTKVADKLTTKFVPHITFVVDEGVKKSIEISRLIREANELAGIKPEETPEVADDESEDSGTDIPPADGPASRPG